MTATVGTITGWLREGRPTTVASLIRVDGSAPHAAGAVLAVSVDGDIVGSVGGGCVDSAIVGQALEAGGRAAGPYLTEFAADDGPWAVGPACGGRLRVLIESLTPEDCRGWTAIQLALADGREVARVTPVVGGRPQAPWIVEDLAGPAARLVPSTAPMRTRSGDRRAKTRDQRDAQRGDQRATTAVRELANAARASGVPTAAAITDEDAELVVQVWPSPPRLIVVGADAVAVSLSELAAAAGYRVTVCDPRPLFTRSTRFPVGTSIVPGWPQDHLWAEARAGGLAGAAVVVLSHDERIEIPALQAALSVPELAFLGALGSRSTQLRRQRQLLAGGADPPAVVRIRGPLGLDLGGREPATIALSILSEVVAARRRGTGRPLHDLELPLHRDPPLG